MVMGFRNRRRQDAFTADDFSKDYPYPPDPIRHFMLADYWLPRDANWSPDFPTAAQQVQALYTLSNGRKTKKPFYEVTIECGKKGDPLGYWIQLKSSFFPRN